jgi:hypothetical protein
MLPNFQDQAETPDDLGADEISAEEWQRLFAGATEEEKVRAAGLDEVPVSER